MRQPGKVISFPSPWKIGGKVTFLLSHAIKATLSLECIEDTCVPYLSLADYRSLYLEIPTLGPFFLEKAHFGNIAAQRRILSLLTSSAKERYEQLIQLYPGLVERVSKPLLATYLGVSRETFVF